MGKRLQKLFLAMAIVFVIPIVALGVSYAVSAKYNSEFREALQQDKIDPSTILDYRVVCAKNIPELVEVCAPASEIQTFEQGAKISIAVGVALFFLLFAGRVYGGNNRARLAFILSPLTRIVLILLSVTIVIQGALFVYGIYIAESVFIHRVHFIALAGAGLVAIFGGFNLIVIALRIMKGATLSQSGILINNDNGDGLIKLVNEVADSVGATRPSNIVVGLEPSFFVTSAKVALSNNSGTLGGTTLYMPLPFLRILNIDELRSVIGHEMGHFKGKDTVYSLKFYPAFSRIESAISSLEGNGEDNSIINLPTLIFLILLHDEFAVAERTIGREREIAADLEGAKVGGAKCLASALLKFSEYAQLWSGIQKLNVETLNEGRVYNNLSEIYYNVAMGAYEEIDFDARRDALLDFKMAHPNDTHPTLHERISALGIDAKTLTKEDLAPSDNSISALISGCDVIADELTISEHRLMIALGYASLPEQAN